VEFGERLAEAHGAAWPAGQEFSEETCRHFTLQDPFAIFRTKVLAPPPQYFDAIAKGAIDAACTTPGYWFDKEKALVMFSSIPFDRLQAKISPGSIMLVANRSWTGSIRGMG